MGAAALVPYWNWNCPRCHRTLVLIRDTCEGRHLLAALTHASGSTADALMADGTLGLQHARDGYTFACACTDGEATHG